MRARTSAVRHLAIAAIAVATPLSVSAAPRARVTSDLRRSPDAPLTGSVCGGGGENRCYAHVVITSAGEIHANAAPSGFAPSDLQSAYQIDPNIATTPTVAIVDAYGYANLEADLAHYRAQFGLPACTIANGCLKIVNQAGQATPLPDDPPASDDWTVETALDVDMVSAACPRCKILVVQANDTSSINLYTAQNSAAAARPTVISDSWGRPQQVGEDLTGHEPYFDHPGIAQFFSGGDSGYNEGGRGPSYPSTSAHVIAVGGTALARSGNARGWIEAAWTMGGSSCSLSIPKTAYQATTPCAFRAATDISAVGDPATGVAVYNANNGGWMVLGGTSAAAPIVAAIFAATGHGDATGAFVKQQVASLFDVTSGSNGACGNILCNAAAGWDGPTGFGTPSAARLAGTTGGGGGGGTVQVMITSPADNATVAAGFVVTANVSMTAVQASFSIDGTLVQTITSGQVKFTAPAGLKPGAHLVEVKVADAAGATAVSQIHVTVSGGGIGGIGIGGDGSGTGTDEPKAAGCQAGRDTGMPTALACLGLAWAARRRRRPAA